MSSPPSPWTSWEEVMEQALVMARKGGDLGEVPVGAVALHAEGEILGRAFNSPIRSRDPSAHAEILALRQAAEKEGNYRLTDLIMVVTLEPCLMCLGAMIHARIQGLVFGAFDQKTGAVVSQIKGTELDWLNHRFWVRPGVLAGKASRLLSAFFKSRR